MCNLIQLMRYVPCMGTTSHGGLNNKTLINIQVFEYAYSQLQTPMVIILPNILRWTE